MITLSIQDEVIFLTKMQDIVQVKLDQPKQAAPTKTLQMRLGDNKTVVVYNHINGNILDALMKAVFDCK